MSTFSLSCVDYDCKMTAGLRLMFENEQMANVTLAVEGKYIKVHQMVLSICSPYFRSLLETNTCNHPIIFMKDVEYHIMKHLLRFMYEGQVEIEEECFQTFVDTAHALQIEWLTAANEQKDEQVDEEEKEESIAKTVTEQRSSSVNSGVKQALPKKTPECEPSDTTSIAIKDELQQEGPNTRNKVARRAMNLSLREENNRTNRNRQTQNGVDLDSVRDNTGNLSNRNLGNENVEIIDNEMADYDKDYDEETDDELIEIVHFNSPKRRNEESTSSREQSRFFADPVDEAVDVLEEYQVTHSSDDESMQMDERDVEDNNSLVEVMEVENPKVGETLTVKFIIVRNRIQMMVNDYRYGKDFTGEVNSSWRCTNRTSRGTNCKSCLHVTIDKLISFSEKHNHSPQYTDYHMVRVINELPFNCTYFATKYNYKLHLQKLRAKGFKYWDQILEKEPETALWIRARSRKPTSKRIP